MTMPIDLDGLSHRIVSACRRSKVRFMNHSRRIVLAVAMISMLTAPSGDVNAQRIESGQSSTVYQYPRSRGLDSNGRATDVEGRWIDQYGLYVDDFGRQSPVAGVPGHLHGEGYTAGGYYPADYSGLGFSNSIGSTVGLSGYSGGYSSPMGPISGGSTRKGVVSPPRSIIVGGVYPSRTVMNNATRGGVMEYTDNGKGYIYTAGSSYQTLISSGPSILPTIDVIQPSQPPVIIEAQKISTFKNSKGESRVAGRVDGHAEIKLMFPKNASGALSYMLNGTVYSINPGYVQTFADDRVWTIEFLRRGNRSQVMRYQLTTGNYVFDSDENGWDLKRAPVAPAADVTSQSPPLTAPAPAPVPSPDL